jgi:hypothetical protein
MPLLSASTQGRVGLALLLGTAALLGHVRTGATQGPSERDFELEIGASSQDIRLTGRVRVDR